MTNIILLFFNDSFKTKIIRNLFWFFVRHFFAHYKVALILRVPLFIWYQQSWASLILPSQSILKKWSWLLVSYAFTTIIWIFRINWLVCWVVSDKEISLALSWLQISLVECSVGSFDVWFGWIFLQVFVLFAIVEAWLMLLVLCCKCWATLLPGWLTHYLKLHYIFFVSVRKLELRWLELWTIVTGNNGRLLLLKWTSVSIM